MDKVINNNKTVDLAKVFEDLQLKNSQYHDLIYDFVTKNKLEKEFHYFLYKNFEDEKYMALDLEHLAMDY